MTIQEKAIEQLERISEHLSAIGEKEDYTDIAIKALETTCIEDYPTCTECEHYDKEKHYCPRFCQVIKDTLAEAQPSEEDFVKHKKEVLERIAKREAEIDKYIKELEKCNQRPCEDCISRTEAIDKLTKLYNMVLDDINIRDIVGTLERLPSVTPQRPKGKWIYEMKVMNNPYTYKCSVCKGWEKDKTKYCPNCGAEMSGGGEDGEDSACDRD